MKRWLLNFIGVGVLVLIPALSFAMPVLTGDNVGVGRWTASDIEDRSAEAVFSLDSDNNLSVVLTNTSGVAVDDPNKVLMAVTFDLFGDPTLTPLSARLTDNTTDSIVGGGALITPGKVTNKVDGVYGEVGGEWSYNPNLDQSVNAPAPLGALQGFGASGLDGLFGNNTDINNTYFKDPDPTKEVDDDGHPFDLQQPQNVDGKQYGIVSSLGITDHGGLVGNRFISYSVTFTLSGIDYYNLDTFNPDDVVSKVSFLYATDYAPSNPVPEPATLILLGSGFIGLIGFKKKKRS